MAFSAKHLCFLVFIFLISSTVIQARESKFFSKFSHYQKSDTANTTTTTKENELNQEQVPSVKPEEGQTSNGYGLYGHDSNQFPSTTTQEYTYPNHLGKTSAEEYTGGSYEEINTKGNFGDNNKQYGMSDSRFMGNPNYNGYETKQNKQYRMSDTRFMDNPNVNNNNGYETKQYDTSDASFLENNNNGYGTKQYGGKVETGNRFMDNGGLNNNNGYKTKQYGTGFAATDNNNKYYDEESLSKSKPQGLSDTRFMENGKYFYNVNNEDSYLNNYQPVNRRYDGFNPSQVVTSRNNYNYGNGEKEYEFNNSNGQSQYQGEENLEEFSP